jgi:hypothetical protein
MLKKSKKDLSNRYEEEIGEVTYEEKMVNVVKKESEKME